MIPLNPLAIKVIAALALIAALVAGYAAWHHHVFAQGQADIQAKWDADKEQRAEAEKAAILRRTQENEAEKEKNRENNRLLQKSYESEIARLRTAIDSAPRMRVGPSFCGGPAGQTEAGSTSSSDAADSGGRMVSEEADRDLKSLEIEVEAAFAVGRACQAFVRENGMAP